LIIDKLNPLTISHTPKTNSLRPSTLPYIASMIVIPNIENILPMNSNKVPV
jgi:hypothetical protein